MGNSESGSIAVLTIVSNNYLHFARTMLQSVKSQHEDATVYCVIVDADLSYARALRTEFETVSLMDLNLPLGDEFLFQYSIIELNTAVKPWAIEYLLSRRHDTVIYVDPDVYFYAPMVEVKASLLAGTDILLTPHLLRPMTDAKTPSEIDILRSGAYNLGFCAVRESRNTRDFLHWWQEKLTRHCVVDMEKGVFVDQGWIDLVPGLFENVGILRHAGYNVAYWNLAQRPITKSADGTYRVEILPLVFFHFSGLDPHDPTGFSKYQNRFILSTSGAASELVGCYIEALLENGATRYSCLEYAFGQFEAGESLPDEVRRLYRASAEFKAQMGDNPFARIAALSERFAEITVNNHSPTNAMAAVWINRPDLRSAYDLNSVASILDFYRWFVSDPMPKRLYADSIIVRHKELIENWMSTELGVNRAAERTTKGTRRVVHLYAFILERAADPAGLRSYTEMCDSLLGYLRAWRHISCSPESKAKPQLASRAAKALFHSV